MACNFINRTLEPQFQQALASLSGQVLILRGARQVGKTTFVHSCLKKLSSTSKQIFINLLYPNISQLDGRPIMVKTFLEPIPLVGIL